MKSIDKAIKVIDAYIFSENDVINYNDQMKFKSQFVKETGISNFYFDGSNAVDKNTGKNISGAKLGMKYGALKNVLKKHFGK